jgi:thiaminase
MIRTLAVNCAPILDCSKDDGKTAVENTSDEMVMGVVRALCQFSPLVSQQNHSDLSHKALEDALKRLYQKKGISREQIMSKSAKDTVDHLLATESDQLCQQKIHKVCAAMVALVYRAETVSTTKRRIFQVRLNTARQAATTWSDADRQKAIERLEREIDQLTPAQRMLFDKLFQCHERQLLHEVGTKATGPRSKFAKELGLKKTASKDEAYRAANMTPNKQLQFHIRLSDAETEATTWSLADTERVTNQLEREIYGITLNEQKRFKTEFSIRMIEFEAWWDTIGIQAVRKTIEQRVIHFGYPKMHLVSHISEAIGRTGSGDNVTTDISDRLHIANVKEAYRSSNKVNYI